MESVTASCISIALLGGEEKGDERETKIGCLVCCLAG